ncbi:hypothetical protein ABT215_38835, partial [Streptomyces sp900105755]
MHRRWGKWGRSALVRPAPADDDPPGRLALPAVQDRPGCRGQGDDMAEPRTFSEQDPIRVFLLDDHEVVRRGI